MAVVEFVAVVESLAVVESVARRVWVGLSKKWEGHRGWESVRWGKKERRKRTTIKSWFVFATYSPALVCFLSPLQSLYPSR